MKPSASITHDHMLLVLASEIAGRKLTGRLRVLDLGCGNGAMIAFLHQGLREICSGVEIEFHGLEVSDSAVQPQGFFAKTLDLLRAECGGEWDERLRMVNSADAWPYADGSFDFVVSNQVLEHVADHPHVLRQIRRVLRDGARSFHVFPLAHYWHEGHLLIPFVHWIGNHDLLQRYIRFWSRLGVGKFRAHRDADPARWTLAFYAEEHADYMSFFTNYLSRSQMLALAKQAGLRCTFRYTEWLYLNRLRKVFRLEPRRVVEATGESGWGHWLATSILMRINSVTVMLEKKQTYSR